MNQNALTGHLLLQSAPAGCRRIFFKKTVAPDFNQRIIARLV
ncbi:MAG: hypothetical protein WC959_03580 [Kiritimatiellales bacterium]